MRYLLLVLLALSCWALVEYIKFLSASRTALEILSADAVREAEAITRGAVNEKD